MEDSINNQDYACSVCGDEGYKQCLVTCFSCRDSQHMYCMMEVKMEVPKDWQCDDCQRKTPDLLVGKSINTSLVECCSLKIPEVESRRCLVEYSDSDSDQDISAIEIASVQTKTSKDSINHSFTATQMDDDIAIVAQTEAKNRKIFIGIDGFNFVPDITKQINKIITGYWSGAYFNWKQIPGDVKDLWWTHFQKTFEWDPTLESDVYKLFKSKASSKIRNFVARAKKDLIKPPHVTKENWVIMKKRFNYPLYVQRCKKASSNRKCVRAGYCGGSVNSQEYRRRMTLKLGRAPTVSEIYNQTRKMRSDKRNRNRASKVVIDSPIGTSEHIDFTPPPYSNDPEGILDSTVHDNAEEDDNFKQYITIVGGNFDPDITREMNRMIIKFWRGPYLNWNQVPQDLKDIWWTQFQKTFRWESTMENEINKLFKKKVGSKIRNFVSQAKLQLKRPSHVKIEDWELMKTKFKETKYVEKCRKVQSIRKKCKDEGVSTYCGGSINANEHRKRLAAELKRQPTLLEVFSRTHKKKKGGWSGRRAEKVAEKIEELQKTQQGLDENNKKDERELWVEAVGGPTPNGRVFGLGYVGKGKILSDQKSSTSQLSLELVQQKTWNKEKDSIISTQHDKIQLLTVKTEALEQANLERDMKYTELKSRLDMIMRLYENSSHRES